MNPPNDDVLAALARLDQSADFAAVKAWFGENLADERATLTTARDAVTIRRAQGAAGLIDAFLSHANAARDTMEKKRFRGGEHP